MPYTDITPEDMSALHPTLFRTSQRSASTSFAAQHVAALDAFDAPRQPSPPAARSRAARINSTDSASNA